MARKVSTTRDTAASPTTSDGKDETGSAKRRRTIAARVPEEPDDPDAPSDPEGPSALPTRAAQRAVIARLYRAISLKLEHMEKRMASGKARSAQDEERESRALATLINNFEKVTEAVAELDQERDATRAGGIGADAERMRREIAERLERLGGVGAPKRAPRKPRA
ncbi:MAG: hypothetical protein AB7S70_03910 [Hyphomicrobium sp.]|uniref:hypothetical protein n=1 Tax=Hyphomicrobium sp. TaxID=82 RepID=UPI003D11A29F